MLDPAKHFARSNSFDPTDCPVLRTIIVSSLQMWKLRLEKIEEFAEDVRVRSWDLKASLNLLVLFHMTDLPMQL